MERFAVSDALNPISPLTPQATPRRAYANAPRYWWFPTTY